MVCSTGKGKKKMERVIDFIVAFFWSIGNLFLAYHVVTDMGSTWDIFYLKEDFLTFKMYWGSLFALSVAVTPAIVAVSANSKENDKKTVATVNSFVVTFLTVLMWGISAFFNFVCY